MVKLPDPPKGWGADDLSGFIDNTRLNSFASYANLRVEYSKLNEIDGIFRKLAENLLNTRDWFAAFFMLRAHSAFLAGSHLAMSGQVVEAYAVLRLAIENALYGIYLSKNPTSQNTWLRRHDSVEAKRRVREEFTIRRLLETLKASSERQAEIAETLYERCIDYGGHPNERALTQGLKTEANETTVNLQIIYLSADSDVLRPCLKTAAQVGVTVLEIFRLIFKERFDLIGLTEKLKQAARGL
jgi:hypothetical protein